MVHQTETDAPATAVKSELCGIVRPIAAWDNCEPDHWAHMQDIFAEACEEAGYFARLVSEAAGPSVIQADIVRNLYSDPVTICDVSGRNPNVMFELGMRVAFQKPVVVVVDDVTPFSFDISPMRHVRYQRDREYKSIVRFKKELVDALRDAEGTSGYLSQFGKIHVTNIDNQTVSIDELADNLASLTGQVSAIGRKIERMTVSATRAMYPTVMATAADTGLAAWSDAGTAASVARDWPSAVASVTAANASRSAAEQATVVAGPLQAK